MNLNLDVSALYLIAAPKTPEPVRQEIIKRAEAGEPMTKTKAVAVLETYKAQAKQVSDTPLHDAMIEAVHQGLSEADAFIENATIDDLPTLLRLATNHEPEHLLMVIRMRSERNAGQLIGECRSVRTRRRRKP